MSNKNRMAVEKAARGIFASVPDESQEAVLIVLLGDLLRRAADAQARRDAEVAENSGLLGCSRIAKSILESVGLE